MSEGKELLNRFPIEGIFLIAAYGLFVIISFPYDIFALFEVCIPRPSSTNTIALTITAICNYLKSNFTPFINAYHLGTNFPNGFFEILLLSLAFGIVAYFLYETFTEVNHVVRHPKPIYLWIKQKTRAHEKKNRKLPTRGSEKRSLQNQLAFADWIKRRGYQKHINLATSMEWTAAGLLWGAETFCLVVFVSCLAISILSTQFDQWLSLLGAFVLVGVSYGLHLAARSRRKKLDNVLRKVFDETRELSFLEEELMRFRRLSKEKGKILKELEFARNEASKKGRSLSSAEAQQSSEAPQP